MLDALPIGLHVVDRDLRVVAWNRLREKGSLGRPENTSHMLLPSGEIHFEGSDRLITRVKPGTKLSKLSVY